MRAVLITGFLACLLARAGGAPAQLEIGSTFEWPSTLQVRCGVSVLGMALSVTAASGGRPEPPLLCVSLPGIQAGALRRSGLLREAAEPLAFSAASEVFTEETRLTLDRTGDAARSGVVCTLAKDQLSFYLMSARDGAAEWGILSRAAIIPGIDFDCAACVSDPADQAPSSSWYIPAAVISGGHVLGTSARLRIRAAELSGTVAAGMSAGDLLLPGAFWHAQVRAERRDAAFAFFMGRADHAWTNPEDGEGSAVEAAFSWQVEVTQGGVTLKAGYAFEQAPPGFSPARVRASAETLECSMEASDLDLAGRTGSLAITAVKRVGWGTSGARSEAARAEFDAGLSDGGTDLHAGLRWNCADGMAAFATLRLPPWRGSSFEVEASLDHLWTGRVDVSVCGSLRRGGGEGRSLRVAAGMRAVPLVAGPVSLLQGLVLRVTWERSSREAGRDR